MGAAARWAVVSAVEAEHFPWPVLVLNIVGSVLLGLAVAEVSSRPSASARLLLHDFAGIGFCGGLTTFSTFAVEVVGLVDDGRSGTALAYGGASVVGAIAGVVAGAAVLRKVRALASPLEGAP